MIIVPILAMTGTTLFSAFGKIPKRRNYTQGNDFAYTPNPQPTNVQFEQTPPTDEPKTDDKS